jgi:hypothetical protein
MFILPFVGFSEARNLRRLTVERFRFGQDLFLCLAFGLQDSEGDSDRDDD